MKNTWSERIKLRMEELDMTQEVLASKLDITRGAVTHYLAGRRVPPLRQFHKMAQVLKTDPAWLQFGVESESLEKKPAIKEKELVLNRHRVPVLSWQEAAEFVYITKEHRKKIKQVLPYFYTDQERWYALQIKSDSMMDVSGHHRHFYEGDYIFIDPERPPDHGDYVVALLPRTTEVVFRQYVVDGGVKYLKPLNIQYPIAKVEKGTVICGTVVGVFAGFFP